MSKPLKRKKILEIGAGTGALASWIKEKGAEILCLDPSKEMIKRCQEKKLSCVQMPIENFETNQKFDGIIAISSLIHLPKENLPKILEKNS